jgi:hypothetical protein
VCPSFLAGNQRALIQARFINRPADSAERIEPPLSALTLVEEVPDSLFDQLIGTLVSAASPHFSPAIGKRPPFVA